MLAKAAGVGATIAMTNGGGIKESVDQGPITLGDVLTIMPYGNTLIQLDLTGQQIVDALEKGVSQVETMGGRFLQVSGIEIIYAILSMRAAILTTVLIVFPRNGQ